MLFALFLHYQLVLANEVFVTPVDAGANGGHDAPRPAPKP